MAHKMYLKLTSKTSVIFGISDIVDIHLTCQAVCIVHFEPMKPQPAQPPLQFTQIVFLMFGSIYSPENSNHLSFHY